MVVGFVCDDGGSKAGGLLPEKPEEGVELAVEGFGVQNAVALAEGFGELAQFVEARRDGHCFGPEVAEVVRQESAAVAVEGVLAEVAAEVGGIGVERGAAGVLDGAELPVKGVDAVGTVAKLAALAVVVACVEGVFDDGGVDDGVERVSVGGSEGVAGEAEEAIARTGGTADGGLADGEREQRAGVGDRRRRAGSSAAVGGELVEISAAERLHGLVLQAGAELLDGGLHGCGPRHIGLASKGFGPEEYAVGGLRVGCAAGIGTAARRGSVDAQDGEVDAGGADEHAR